MIVTNKLLYTVNALKSRILAKNTYKKIQHNLVILD